MGGERGADEVPGAGDDIYRADFVRGLFDEMAATYGVVNVLSSFGFCVRWRRQCVGAVPIAAGDRVLDLMSGMGELWPDVARTAGGAGRIEAVDFSSVMCDRARGTAERLAGTEIAVRQEDVLANTIPDASSDVVVSSFGLKTFTPAQRAALAGEVARVLRPGGRFSFVEISVPPSPLLRVPFLFYLRSVVPWIGRALLGNPDNYRLLGVYTTAFGHCADFGLQCEAAGLRAEVRRLFGGCATAVVGRKPGAD